MAGEEGAPQAAPPIVMAPAVARRRGPLRWAVGGIVVVVIAALALGGLLATGHNLFGASVGGPWTITFNHGQEAAHLNLSQSFWSISGSIEAGQGLTLPVAGGVSGQSVTFSGSYAPSGSGLVEDYSFAGVVAASGRTMSGTFHDTVGPRSGPGRTSSASGSWSATRV